MKNEFDVAKSSGRWRWSSKEGGRFKEVEAGLQPVSVKADKKLEVRFEQTIPLLSCECTGGQDMEAF